MATKSAWWAVWLAEYPEEGSIHVRARTRREAVARARLTEWFGTAECEDPPELVASQVTDAGHRRWLRSDEPTTFVRAPPTRDPGCPPWVDR